MSYFAKTPFAIALVLVGAILISGCPDVNICSGNTINDQVDPPNDEDNVICGVSANE